MKEFALLVARVVAGSLVAGHGAQKLFGWSGGPGLQKWTAATESMGMKPGWFFGPLGALGEFGGGMLTALGFLNPLGPIAMGSMMIAAAVKGHWGKPIWASAGGAELAVSFLSSTVIAGTHEPGRLSLDSLLGIRLPRWITGIALLGSATMLVGAIRPDLLQRVARADTTQQAEER